MGLDMNPIGAPKPGMEAAFDDILGQIIALSQGKNPAGGGLLKWLFGARPDRDVLVDRFNKISIPHYATLGAPIVGVDSAAADWIREEFAAGNLDPEFETADEALSALDGRHMIEMLPDCDGFPFYTNGELTSFRGQLLTQCSDVLEKSLIKQAWETMTATDLADYGKALDARARAYAEAQGVTEVLTMSEPKWEVDTSPQAQAHIVVSLARWAAFWSAKGHGSEADY